MFVVDAKIIRDEFDVLEVGIGMDTIVSLGLGELLTTFKVNILKNSVWIPDADDREIGESSRLHQLRGR